MAHPKGVRLNEYMSIEGLPFTSLPTCHYFQKLGLCSVKKNLKQSKQMQGTFHVIKGHDNVHWLQRREADCQSYEADFSPVTSSFMDETPHYFSSNQILFDCALVRETS